MRGYTSIKIKMGHCLLLRTALELQIERRYSGHGAYTAAKAQLAAKDSADSLRPVTLHMLLWDARNPLNFVGEEAMWDSIFSQDLAGEAIPQILAKLCNSTYHSGAGVVRSPAAGAIVADDLEVVACIAFVFAGVWTGSQIYPLLPMWVWTGVLRL